MRLWHVELISVLPRQQLISQMLLYNNLIKNKGEMKNE